MSSHPPGTKKPPISGPSFKLPKSAGFHGGYVSRLKLQQQRIRTLNQLDDSSDGRKKTTIKSLPKIQAGHPDKENLVIKAVQRSNTIDVVKLPGVKPVPPPVAPPTYKKKSLPMKTYHLRVNPEHTSFISKSLPSLPSIPGSPSYPEDQAVSPLTERVTEKDKAKVPVYSKHRFEKIVFQKHIHNDTNEGAKKVPKEAEDGGNRRLPAHIKMSHLDRGPNLLPLDLSARSQEKPHTSGSLRIRYSKMPSEVVISETQSEPSFEISRKWKENCRCLRCQMLRRQFQEGDSHYGLWGRYPCHHIDPSVMLDD